jgi:hypothetical protein
MHRLWESMNEEVRGAIFWPVAMGVIGLGSVIVLVH